MSKIKRTALSVELGDPTLPILNQEVGHRVKRKERAALKKTIQQAVLLAYGPKHPKLLQGANLTSIFAPLPVPPELARLVGEVLPGRARP